MTHFRAALVLTALTAITAAAAPIAFDLKDPKGVNAVSIVLDSTVEPLMAIASGVSGELLYDPASPQATTGSIQVDASTLTFANERMTAIALGDKWLDVETHPQISFTFGKVTQAVQKSETRQELTVEGTFSCHGQSKPLTVVVDLSYLKDRYADRHGKGEGDLLIVRSNFSISRSDFGVSPETGPVKVAEVIEVRVAVTAVAPR